MGQEFAFLCAFPQRGILSRATAYSKRESRGTAAILRVQRSIKARAPTFKRGKKCQSALDWEPGSLLHVGAQSSPIRSSTVLRVSYFAHFVATAKAPA
jgi:hypothetical protein